MNVKNTSGIPRKACLRPSCKKKIPLRTIHGRIKSLARLEAQKYCSDVCARKHYHEENAITAAELAKAQDAIDSFIYSGRGHGNSYRT